ncbi:MAG: PAS domain S-box protein [Bacteroidales bacterium]|nr:PAS domain S-box protein [Bacteroidales bacterium]
MKQKPAYEDLQREVESLQQKIAEIKMGKKFLSFFENNKAAMLEIDAETKKIVNANPQALLFYGYSKEEFLKKSIYDLQTLPPEEVNVLMKKAINSPANYFEFRHKLANGEIKDVQVFQSTFHFEDNIHFVATVNDITESLKNQFDLIEAKVIAEESRKYLDNIINSIGDPVFVKDDDSRLLLVNDAFCEIFGLSRENIIGKTLAEDVTPEEQEIFLRIDKQVLKDGKENINEEQLTVRGGETRTISTRKSRFIDSYGNKFLVGAIRDITERKKIEEALRESEERFKMLFEKAPLGYQSLDIEGNLIEVNDTWSETLGFSKNEALGKWFGDFLTAPSRDAFRERFKAFKSMGKVHVVFEMIKKDGSVGIYSIYGRIGHTPTGEFKQTHCVLTDITERRKAEDALAKVNNQKSLILNSAGEGIIGLNLNGEHTFFNQSALNLLGYSEEEFSGKGSHTLWHHQTISGEKISMEKSLIQDTIKTGKSHRVIDEVFWRKDGSYIPVEYIVSPVYEDNQLAGAVVTFSDISIRKKAEEKIKELSQAVEQSPASIVITNLKGEIEYTNPKFTEITGYSPDEALGKNPRILKSGETSRDEYEKLWSTIASGKDWRGTFHNIKKNGELYWESASISPIRNYEGKITHFLAVKEDITERIQKENELRAAKEKAEESDRLKSAFLANMSHEIRTPMNGILGFAELLNTPGLSLEKQQKYISVIEKSGNRMLNIINDIISISKIESGQMEIDLQETNINEQMEFICSFFKP